MSKLACCNQDGMDKIEAHEHGDLRLVPGDCDTCKAKKADGAAMMFCGMQVFIWQSCCRGLGL